MELIGIIIAAILGWKIGGVGAREIKGIALVAGGWTLVTATASVPDVSLLGTLYSFVYAIAVIAVPFGLAALFSRWHAR